MDIYLAGANLWKYPIEAGVLNAQFGKNVNILQSFYYEDPAITNLIPHLKNYMLDSGAFTFFLAGKHVDWNLYVQKYCDYINQHDVKLFFELDIDALIGYEKVKQIRKTIEQKTGKQPIPVWHQNRGKEEFVNMCKEYSYVAIGGLVGAGGQQGEYNRKYWKYFSWFIETAHSYGAKIHALGFTATSALKKYHFDSVDSSAWTTGNRYGGVYKFTGNNIVRMNVPPGKKMITSAVAIHNYCEWVKYANYAITHL